MKRITFLFCLILISFASKSQVPAYTVTVNDISSAGYYFLSDELTSAILDGKGNLIYYKYGTPCFSLTLQSNGMMTYSDLKKFFFMDSTFRTVDSIECKNGYSTDFHDFRVLPNGHFLLIGKEEVKMDLRSYPFWKKKFGVDTIVGLLEIIQEQDAGKNIVFEWHEKDHLDVDNSDTSLLVIAKGAVELTHSNAVEMDHDGNILLSSRKLSEITKINRSTGDVIWRLGGNHNQFKFVNCPVPFYGQHDVRRISNGHITLFDGGCGTVTHGARALEFELDELNKIATLKWSYTLDSAATSCRHGNVQRLSSTKTLINFGKISHNDIGFVMVDSTGKKFFQLDGIKSYRVFNYPSLPWLLRRPQINCFDSLGVNYLDAGAGHRKYKWSNGDTTRLIPVTAVGDYSVFVPYGDGGFITSEKFNVTDISHPCGLPAVKGNKKKKDKK